MNDLITLNSDTMTVSARELHEKLNIETPFHKWFPRMCDYGFIEGTDFWTKMSESTGGRPATDGEDDEICYLASKKILDYALELRKILEAES